MALDRRIVIERNEGDFAIDGSFVDDWQAFASVWAERRSAGATDVELAGGVQTVESVTWLVRWRSDLLTADVAVLRIRDSSGLLWSIESMGESDERRRFVSISAVRAS